MSRISELNDELQGVRNTKDYLARHGGDTSEQVAKEAEILRLIAEGEREAKEAVIEGVAQDITSSIETFTVGDITFTLDQLVVDEDAADILRSGLRTISKAQAQKFLEEIESQKAVYESQLSNKQSLLDHVTTDRDACQNANAQLQLERDDLSEKRDAAAMQLLEAQAEIARLNSHVDDLRKEIAVGATNAPNIIDITSDADLEAAAQRLKAKKEKDAADKRAAEEAARVRIYGVTQLDGTGAQFGAYRADDDTYLTFGWLEKNKYVELSTEELERFRQELEAARKEELESTPEAEITPEPVEEQFRPEPLPAPDLSNVDAGHGLDENVTEGQDGQDDGRGSVTREEFEALRHEVTMIAVELKSRSILPHNWEAA